MIQESKNASIQMYTNSAVSDESAHLHWSLWVLMSQKFDQQQTFWFRAV